MTRRLPIRRLASCALGKMVTSGPGTPGSVEAPYLRAAHIQPGGKVIDLEHQQMWFTPAELSALTLRRGDVVVVEGGAGYGRSATLLEDRPGWGFQNSIVRIRPRPGLAEGRYIDYALQASLGAGMIAAEVSTATIPHFTAEKVASFAIPALPIGDQRRVADFLDRETAQIDALIAQQHRFIAHARERSSAMVDHFTWSGLDPATERSASGLTLQPVAPAHWQRSRNKNLLRESSAISTDGTEEMLSVSHLTGITPRSEKNVTMFEAESTVGYKLVRPGDLVINTMWAWMGALGVSRHSGLVSPAYGVYSPVAGAPVHPTYFNYLYRSTPYIGEMTSRSRGITSSRLRLYPDVFLGMPVIVPPLDEQRRIAERLSKETAKVDALIGKTHEHLALAKERRTALITAAVAGQIDVTRKVS